MLVLKLQFTYKLFEKLVKKADSWAAYPDGDSVKPGTQLSPKLLTSVWGNTDIVATEPCEECWCRKSSRTPEAGEGKCLLDEHHRGRGAAGHQRGRSECWQWSPEDKKHPGGLTSRLAWPDTVLPSWNQSVQLFLSLDHICP